MKVIGVLLLLLCLAVPVWAVDMPYVGEPALYCVIDSHTGVTHEYAATVCAVWPAPTNPFLRPYQLVNLSVISAQGDASGRLRVPFILPPTFIPDTGAYAVPMTQQ